MKGAIFKGLLGIGVGLALIIWVWRTPATSTGARAGNIRLIGLGLIAGGWGIVQVIPSKRGERREDD